MTIFIAIIAVIIIGILITISMHYVVTSRKPEDSKIKYLHQVYELLELCKLECDEENVLNRVDEIISSIRYGDVNSPEAARNIEVRIISKSSELLGNLKNKRKEEANRNLDELEMLTKERNVVSKNNKYRGM